MTNPAKKLFISWRAVASGDDHLLQPGVIPALHKLLQVGYGLTLVNVPDSLQSMPVLQLLDAQGLKWERTLGLESSSMEQSGAASSSHWSHAAFCLIRDDIWERQLDRQRSRVVGLGDEAAGLAEILGLEYLGLGSVMTKPASPRGTMQHPLYACTDQTLSWAKVAENLTRVRRMGRAVRRTKETDITVTVDLGGDPALSRIHTGIGFFDHMLDQIARHGGMELNISTQGDVEIDDHHTVEDTGLALGTALRQALGDRRGIQRYGFTLPMDESLATCALDLGGRPGMFFSGTFSREKVGELATEMVPHFFQSLSQTLGATIHIQMTGHNAHHQVEAVFKVVAKSLKGATELSGEAAIPSTKGAI